jgi:hypothetical protein
MSGDGVGRDIAVADPGIFQRGMFVPPLHLVVRGGSGKIPLSFFVSKLKGVPFSKCVIFTQCWQIFFTRGGGEVRPPDPPMY